MTRRNASSVLMLAAIVLGLLTVNATPAAAAPYREMGGGPWSSIVNAADANGKCAGLSTEKLTALMFAPTWGESGDPTPAPMAHGQADTPITWGNNRWYQGIGMWQMDDRGAGMPFAAYERIDTDFIAPVVAGMVADPWCAGGSEYQRANRAWGCGAGGGICSRWYACSYDACWNIFNDIFDGTYIQNVQVNFGVSHTGGIQSEACWLQDAQSWWSCWRIDRANYEGTNSNNGPQRPYYSMNRPSSYGPYDEWDFYWQDGSWWPGAKAIRNLTFASGGGWPAWSSWPNSCDYSIYPAIGNC